MIVAIDLANGSAQRAFELGTETVTGRATHQIIGGPSGLDEAIYTRCAARPGYRAQRAGGRELRHGRRHSTASPCACLASTPLPRRPSAAIWGRATRPRRPPPTTCAELMAQPGHRAV